MALPNSRVAVFIYAVLLLIVFSALATYTVKFIRSGKTVFDGMATEIERFTGTAGITVTYYTLNGCPHCTAFNPEWSAFEKMAKIEGITTQKYDARTDREAIEKAGVDGFPTITLTYPDPKNGTPTTVTYNGERKASALMEAAKSKAKK
jgi:glutaredoxin